MADGALEQHVPQDIRIAFGTAQSRALLSEDALRIIASLQGQLKRANWKLRAAENAAEKALDNAEECGAQMDAKYDRHQQVERSLKRLHEEREQDTTHEELLTMHLTELQEELLETKSRLSRTVPREEVEALRGEIQRLRAQLSEAEQEGRELHTQLAEAEEMRRKRSRRPASESESSRQPARYQRGIRMSEARQRSARAVSEQKERDAKMQAERMAQLTRHKEKLQEEWHELCQHNLELQDLLELMRGRIRKLEAMQRRCYEVNKEQEAPLHEELRRHMRQLSVLRGLLDGDGALDSNYINGSHHLNSQAETQDAALDARPRCVESSGSTFGSLTPVAAADDVPASAGVPLRDDPPEVLTSALFDPPEGPNSGSSSSAQTDASKLVVSQGNANRQLERQNAQDNGKKFLEHTDQCLGRLDAAISRTHGLLGEVKDWYSDLGNDPGSSRMIQRQGSEERLSLD